MNPNSIMRREISIDQETGRQLSEAMETLAFLCALWCAPPRAAQRMAALLLALSLSAFGAPGDKVSWDPFEPKQAEYQTALLIVGGSSSGTAAALTAGRLQIPTIWILRAPRDMGGRSTNAINPDSDLPMRHPGGLALEVRVPENE